MLSKNRLYAFVILNVLLLLVAVLLFGVLFTRDIPPPVLSPEGRRELIDKITSIDKLRGMAKRDDMYIRALDNWISTMRLILLGSGALVGAFAITQARHAPIFREVMTSLRDVAQNPEWAYVREGPEWWGRRVRSAAALWGEK